MVSGVWRRFLNEYFFMRIFSNDRMEFLLKDRLFFTRFLRMENERSVFPDAKTIRLFKEKLREAELMSKIFCCQSLLEKNGFT
uniref:Transposase PF05598 domain protein n=2 Tax=Leptospira santarosai TaxID=28183 RepID=M6JLA6_9LEPT|nr:transposase PF05598 domain protein [Leptospira santarosai serovar Arenal str. MAVJ 401]